MRDVFLVEPLADARLFAALTGGAAGDGTPAVLANHAIRAGHDGLGIGPVRTPDAAAPGFVVSLGREAREALEFYMSATGLAPMVAPVELEGGGGRRVVDTWVLPGALAERDWSRGSWEGEWRDLVCEAAEEVGRLRGHKGNEEMPTLMTGIGYRALGRARGRRAACPAEIRSTFGPADVELLRSEPAYANYFAVDEYLLRFRRFDGSLSAPVERAVFGSGDAVTLLPYDPVRDTVLLVEQFRTGPFARGEADPWCLECVAGRCDPMEAPEATARREAEEEAGLRIGRVERVGAYYSSVGMLSEYLTAFVGEADLSSAGGEFGLAVEDEDIRAHVVTRTAAMEAVASGEVNNGPTIIALLWLDKHAERLRHAWAAA